jgi:hypothetical protein
MLMRMMMTTVAALALAAPVTAQDKAQPEAAQQLEQAQQTLQQQSQGGQTGAAEQPATAAQQQPAEGEAVTTEEEPTEGEAEVAEEGEAAPPADMTFIEVQDEAQFLADEEVIGKEVVNVMDEEVGTIADLVMDQDQKLVGVVLSVGGFLGIGDKWVAIPVEEIDFPAADQPARLLVAVTEEQLKNAPDFTTRETVEAEEAAEQAQMQQQQQQQMPQTPAPAATQQ